MRSDHVAGCGSHGVQLAAARLVGFGQNNLIRYSCPVEELHDFAIQRLYPVPRIDEQENAYESRAATQIGPHQLDPGFDLLFWRLRKTVARQIDDIERHVRCGEEVELLRTTGCARCAGQSALTYNCIDETGFADVGPPSECDFGPVCFRQELQRRHAAHEDPWTGEQGSPRRDPLGTRCVSLICDSCCSAPRGLHHCLLRLAGYPLALCALASALRVAARSWTPA